MRNEESFFIIGGDLTSSNPLTLGILKAGAFVCSRLIGDFFIVDVFSFVGAENLLS